MIKTILVETVGSFMLLDPYNGQEINHARPTVVRVTGFIEVKIAQGDLKVLSDDLREDATDAEFAQYWVDSDKKAPLAIESFLSAFAKMAVSSKGAKEDDSDAPASGIWTREALEEVADRDGMDGLRAIATPMGVKGRAKEELINEILAVQ